MWFTLRNRRWLVRWWWRWGFARFHAGHITFVQVGPVTVSWRPYPCPPPVIIPDEELGI